MKDALAVIDKEIAVLAARLDGLNHARYLLAGATQLGGAASPVPLLLEAPRRRGAAKKAAKGRAKKGTAKKIAPPEPPARGPEHTGTWTVNGVDVPCTEQQEAMLEMLMAAEGDSCVSGATLLPIFDNSKFRMRRAIEDCCVQLAPARATIQSVKSQGYRLINVED